jgi:hypothetical protein
MKPGWKVLNNNNLSSNVSTYNGTASYAQMEIKEEATVSEEIYHRHNDDTSVETTNL